MVINFQSIPLKNESFDTMLEYCDQDVKLAIKTRLNPTLAEKVVLPTCKLRICSKDNRLHTESLQCLISLHDLGTTSPGLVEILILPT